MKKQSTQILLICSFVLFLGACRARFYTPNRNPIPLFKQKGDVFIDGSTNLINKYDLTLGYALTHDIAAYAGYAGAGIQGDFPDEDSINDRYKYAGNMLNLGVGYFLNQDISEHFRFEVFADYGRGNYRNSVNGDANNFFNGQFQRIGIMPNIAYANNNFSIAYSMRASQISFSNASISDTAFWSSDIRRLNSRDNYMMLEQCIQFRFGFEHVKFQAQFAAYNTLNSNDENNALPEFNASIMVGIAINMNVFGKKTE
jgi:hypothetical protein